MPDPEEGVFVFGGQNGAAPVGSEEQTAALASALPIAPPSEYYETLKAAIGSDPSNPALLAEVLCRIMDDTHEIRLIHERLFTQIAGMKDSPIMKILERFGG